MTTTTRPADRLTRPRVGWPPPVGPGRVAGWQVAILVLLATAPLATPLAVTATTLAVVVLAATSVRVGGLCGHQWAVVLLRFALRRRRVSAPPVAVLAPTLQVHPHADRVGNRAGVAAFGDPDRPTDHVAVVRIAAAAQPDPAMLVAVLGRAFDRADHPVSGARLVVWAVPASPWPVRVHWLALRYRVADAPWAALARGGGPTGGRRAVTSAAQRLVGDLAGAGCASAVLDAAELGQELRVALGVGPDPGGNPGGNPGSVAGTVTETWRAWSAGGTWQGCFTPRSPGDAVGLLGRCVPEASFTCTAYELGRDARNRTTVTARLRVGVPAGGYWLTPDQAAAKLGVRLLPAHGRQAAAVLGTLPLA